MARDVAVASLATVATPSRKKRQPGLPVAPIADGLEQLVVALLVPAEMVREVEHRPLHDFPLEEEEGDEQPADAAIAVQEGVDGLELGMDEANLH
jgi:hypothetical protein